MKREGWNTGFLKSLLLIFTVLLLSSCASTKLTNSWYDTEYSGKNLLQDVLIIGISKDETVRRLFEDRFVAILDQAGIDAIQSYSLKASDIQPTRAAVEEAVKEADAKFVLITRHLSTDTTEHYRPPERVTVYADPYYSRVYRYYPMAYREVYYTPGYSYEVTTVSMESNLYDASTEKLVWSAQSQSVDPKMTQKYIDVLIDVFTKDMKEKGLL